MTFTDARERLAVLAKGKYRATSYELSELADGGLEAECRVYVDGYGWHSGPSWSAALDALRYQIEGDENTVPKPDLAEAPGGEA